jgi:predicted kinase
LHTNFLVIVGLPVCEQIAVDCKHTSQPYRRSPVRSWLTFPQDTEAPGTVGLVRALGWTHVVDVQSMSTAAKLVFLCGKMAAGKSTLARDLAERENAILLVQDEFLASLFPGEITDIPGYIKCSSRLNDALAPHICALLSKGISVVLDFPANTKRQRAWFRRILERANVEHELHFLDASDTVCKSQLKDRSKHLPPGTPWTTDAEFEAVTAYFQPPSEDEKFNVVRHERVAHAGVDRATAT